MMYAPVDEQPKQNLTREEMTEVSASSYTLYVHILNYAVV